MVRIVAQWGCRVGLLLLMGTMLTGCTQLTQVQSLINNVRTGFAGIANALAPVAAVALVFYIVAYAILFFLQPVWPDGYRTVQNTAKTAIIIFGILLVVLPALAAWASSYTLAVPSSP